MSYMAYKFQIYYIGKNALLLRDGIKEKQYFFFVFLLLLLLLLLFLGPLPRHMEVPRLGVESEL